jgi:Fe2+ transport system protein FeoA
VRERSDEGKQAKMKVSRISSRRRGRSDPDDARGSLATLTSGSAARVVRVRGTGPVAQRLMEMGLVPGTPIRFVRVAPLGDPIQVRVRNYHLALRRNEAQAILVLAGH